MNELLLWMVGFLTVFVVIPGTVFVILWFKSYNRVAIVFREVGNEPNNSLVEIVKCKVVKNRNLGWVIRYFPTSKILESKYFGSEYWMRISQGKTIRQGIMVYVQGVNIRPCKVVHKDKAHYVVAVDEDNRDFVIRRLAHKIDNRADKWLSFLSFAVLTVFLLLMFGGYLFAHLYLTEENVKSFIQEIDRQQKILNSVNTTEYING